MKNLLLSISLLIATHCFSQNKGLDSLLSVWEDENQADTNRLKAISHYIVKGVMYSKPDSAFKLAEMEYKFAELKKQSRYMIMARNIQATTLRIMSRNEEAIDYYNHALVLSEEAKDKISMSKVISNLGTVYYFQGNYAKAIDIYFKGLALAEELGKRADIASSYNNIGIIYMDQKDYDKALEFFSKSLAIKEELGMKEDIASTLLNIGGVHRSMKQYAIANDYFYRGYMLSKELGNASMMGTALYSLGNIAGDRKDYEKALEYFKSYLDISEQTGETSKIASGLVGIGGTYRRLGDNAKALSYLKKGLEVAEDSDAIAQIEFATAQLYLTYKAMGRDREALEMYEWSAKMSDSIESEKNQREVLRQEYKYQYEKEALTDSLQYAQKEAVMQEKSKRQQVGLAATGGGVVLLIALVLAIYRGKKRSDELLLNILPSETAKELKQKGYADARHYDEVTVLFTDFKGFTQISERLTPKELVAEIDECFKAFDHIVGKFGIEKIKTIGDAYMAAAGLPVPQKTNANDVIRAALEMRDWMLKHKEQKGENGFEIRIGIHTGPVVAGIVGIKKFQYDIWGDTVNTASRMESSGEVGKVNISGATYELIKTRYNCQYRGKIKAKGKGEVDMYFVEKADNIQA